MVGRVIKIDTIYVQDTIKKVIMLDRTQMNQSEYYDLYDKLMKENAEHYNSAIHTVELFVACLTLFFAFVLAGLVWLGWDKYKEMKSDLERDINVRIRDEARRVADQLVTDKYEKDMTELKEKTNNLETFTQEISDAYVQRHDKEKPILPTSVKKPIPTDDPFEGLK
jgi:lipid II:glycine glycyltransferase (peptidoglycan interpeptide bridge formation enzyme)